MIGNTFKIKKYNSSTKITLCWHASTWLFLLPCRPPSTHPTPYSPCTVLVCTYLLLLSPPPHTPSSARVSSSSIYYIRSSTSSFVVIPCTRLNSRIIYGLVGCRLLLCLAPSQLLNSDGTMPVHLLCLIQDVVAFLHCLRTATQPNDIRMLVTEAGNTTTGGDTEAVTGCEGVRWAAVHLR